MDPTTTVVDTFTLVATCLAISIASLGILYSAFRNFKADMKAEIEDVRDEMKDIRGEVKELRVEMNNNMEKLQNKVHADMALFKDEMRSLNERQEQRFAAQEQRFNSMDERMFFALTGRSLQDAILEGQAKKQEAASHQPTATT